VVLLSIILGYWANTSNDKIISSLLSDSSETNFRKRFDTLLKDGEVIQEILENYGFLVIFVRRTAFTGVFQIFS
jgi:hypothetical protein